jgi:hypothetical protein
MFSEPPPRGRVLSGGCAGRRDSISFPGFDGFVLSCWGLGWGVMPVGGSGRERPVCEVPVDRVS